MNWILSSSSAGLALALVDGTGSFREHGPHYSRRTPGSRTFTGMGKEIVLVTEDGTAVWACVYARAPAGGVSLFRNNVFRNLGRSLSSDLIREAVRRTYEEWQWKYRVLPPERLRTEIDTRKVRSTNPGCCYRYAGWERGENVRGKLYMFAPLRV